MGVDEQDVVPLALEQRACVAVLERQVRFAASEIDAALERPPRIDQRVLHDAALAPTTSGTTVPDSINHDASRERPSPIAVRARQPVACWKREVFET